MAKSDPHSLTNLLASLTRSQYGAATAQVADDQLDRHVAQLLLDEAKSASATWGSRTSSASTQLPYVRLGSIQLTGQTSEDDLALSDQHPQGRGGTQ